MAEPQETLPALEFEQPIVELQQRIRELESCAASEHMDFSGELKVLREKCEKLRQSVYGNLVPWQRVQIARHPKRPYTLDYIQKLFQDFLELHGDRRFSDDPAIVSGFALFDGSPVAVIGHQKGRTVQESMHRNFGMPHPEGYRKALRIMKLAEKFGRPIICFIDTPGAYPGIGAEERGQAQAIAENLREMAALRVPVVCVVIGEGGSGGALAVGVGDRVLMCENAWYSVISPEGCAAILFHDAAKAPQAAEALKLSATDLLSLKAIDAIIPEPLGGAHHDYDQTANAVGEAIRNALKEVVPLDPVKRVEERYQRLRGMGAWIENGRTAVPAEKPKTKSKKPPKASKPSE